MSSPGSTTADQLKGVAIYGASDDKIAEISDIELGTDGTATGIITDVGGFLGMGAKPVALSLSQISVYKNADGDMRAYTMLTKDQLEALPEYKAPK